MQPHAHAHAHATPAALSEDPNREPAVEGRFAIAWHITTFGLMGLYLVIALYDAVHSGSFGLPQIALIGLTAAQAGIYYYAFVRADCWLPNKRRLFLNFVVGPAIVFVQQAIAPIFANMWWLYLGHNFSGALPPWAAIPNIGLMILFFFGARDDWQLQNLNTVEIVIALLTFGVSAVAYLFIRRSSQERDNHARLLAELQQAYRELDAAREYETEFAALKERERIARDMHDNLGHALVALSVQLEAAQRLYKVDSERASKQMDEMKQLTRESMDALRRTIAGLRVPGLGERPLHQALQELSVAVSQRSDTSITCHVDPEVDHLSHALTDTLWSVTQEALTNIEKHAHACHADISIHIEPQTVKWRMSDDGVGITPNAFNRNGHYGLLGMRERVEGVGGSLSIATNRPNGTLVEAALPNPTGTFGL